MTDTQMLTTWLWAMVTVRRAEARRETGAGDIVQTVILVGIFAAAAITIGTIIVNKFIDEAHTIPTGG